MEPSYSCGRKCQEQDWVDFDGRLGYVQGDGWRMCMGTGFEWAEDIDMWVVYPLFRDEDGVWRHEVVPLSHVKYIGHGACYEIPTSPS